MSKRNEFNEITAQEANRLLQLRKVDADPSKTYEMPGPEGGIVLVDLVAEDESEPERFVFHINKRRIVLTSTYQTRTKSGTVLARLDFDAGHRNPDGSKVGIPHLHYYVEGYGDHWATDKIDFLSDPNDPAAVISDFLRYCNVVKQPKIIPNLF
jgi:hypothetical protein